MSGTTTVCASSNGGTLTLSGQTGLVTKWQSSTDGGTTWSDIANSTSSLVYSNIIQSTRYRAVVVNGVCAATNSSDVLILVDQPAIGGATSGATSVCSGSNSGSINLSGQSGSVNKWQFSINSGLTWADIANTTSSLSYNNLTQTTSYRAVLSNGVCPVVNSSVTTISLDNPSIGGSIAGSATVCETGNFGLLTLSGNNGSIVKWQSSIDGGNTWNDIANTTNQQPYNNLAQTTQFQAIISNGSCPVVSSSSATIAVVTASNGGTATGDAEVCASGNSGSIVLSGYNGSILKWQNSTNAGLSWTDIANTTSTQAYNNLGATSIYRAVVQNGVCASVNSSIATITVDDISNAGSLTAGTTVCTGANSGAIFVNGYNGNIQNWELSTDNGSTWSPLNITADSYNFLNLTQTSSYRAVVQNGVCAAATSSVSTIVVNPTTVAGILSSDALVCGAGNSGTLNLTGNVGNILKWQFSMDGGLTYSDITNTTSSQNYLNLSTTTLYRAIVQSPACATELSNAVTISVTSPSQGGTVGSDNSVCSGSNNGSVSLTGFDGSILKWQSSDNGGLSWSDIANTTTLQLYNNLTTTTMYRAVVQNGICPAANSTSSTITVNALPTASISGNTEICSIGSNPTSLLSSNAIAGTGAITGFDWKLNGTSLGAPNTTTYAASATGSYTVTVTNSASCSATSSAFSIGLSNYSITQNAGSNGTISGPTSVVCGGSATLLINANSCYYISTLSVNGNPIALDPFDADYVLQLNDVSTNYSVVATFAQLQYQFTVSTSLLAGATVSVSPLGSFIKNCGSSQTISITPDACSDIQDIIINGISSGNTTSFTINNINQNYNIIVVAARRSYTVTATAGAGGTISNAGVVNYLCGSTPTYTITPSTGYAITGVIVNGNPVGALNSITLPALNGNVAIQATFAPRPYYDRWDTPFQAITPTFPSCIVSNSTLEGCTSSPEGDDDYPAPVGSGQDAWFRIQIPSGSLGTARFVVNTTSNDVAIVLQRELPSAPFRQLIAVENAVNGIGPEMMTAMNLVPGAVYRVGVRNMGLQPTGPFTFCSSSVRAVACGTLTSASNTKSLCDVFLGAYTGANSYTFTFTNTSNPSEVITRTLTGQGNSPAGTAMIMESLTGMRYGATYDVRIGATYLFANGNGVISPYNVPATAPACQLFVSPQPNTELSSADYCAVAPKLLNSFISTTWVCGAVDYRWEISPTIGLPTWYTTYRGAPNRFMRVGSLNGINAGGTTFNVRVAPIFDDGQGGTRLGTWSQVNRQMCIVAGALAPYNGQDQQAIEKSLIEQEEIASFNLYPNPNNGRDITLNLVNMHDKVRLRVTDISGRLVLEQQITVEGNLTTKMPTNGGFAPGVYNVQIIESGNIYNQTMVVER